MYWKINTVMAIFILCLIAKVQTHPDLFGVALECHFASLSSKMQNVSQRLDCMFVTVNCNE